MIPLPPTNTARFRGFYTTIGHQHSIQVRSHASPAVVGELMHQLMVRLDIAAAPRTFDFMDWAPEGSDIFNPVTMGHEGQAYDGAPDFVPHHAAWAYTCQGRTSGGRRVRLALFGAVYSGDDYRIDASTSAIIANVISALTGAGSNIIGIDGLVPIWKPYVTVQINDHWVKELRP